MTHRTSFALVALVLACALCLTQVTPCSAQTTPAMLKGVGIDQHLGQQIPLDLTFNEEDGKPVRLADLRDGRPVILLLVYYECPMLCTLVLNNTLSTAKVVPLKVGQQYDIWAISFDPNETPAMAAKKRDDYVPAYDHTRGTHSAAGWHFLTGNAANIKKLTDAVGFRYKWDIDSKQYIHPAGITILTPDLKVARYYFGINYDPTDIRLSLVEASGGKIGSFTDHVLLFCCRYDPKTGRYGLAVANALRVGGALTILGIGLLIYFAWRHDIRRTRRLMAQSRDTELTDAGGPR